MSGLYMPMFMFTGEYEIGFDPTERLYRARVPALFRNALDPGQYPYPFWHDAKKWADYQAANELTFWIDPAKVKVVIMQFSARGRPDPKLTSVPYTRPTFDGKWMWMDAKGQSQPQPTLFVGLMRSTNPYLGQLDSTFRELAGELRKGSCHECHSPDNYTGMKRLVLMQTPAHAAGEIKRIMRAVREEKMPLDDAGLYKEMDPAIKATLLKQGAAFELVVDAGLLSLALAQPVANEVVQWNETTMKFIEANGQAPPVSTRTLAMVHGAVHDALNAINRKYDA
jgi:hypothetical protein